MWQLITVAPNSEARVSRVLDEGLDLDALAFRVRRRVVIRGRVLVRSVPAFPGYMFVSAAASLDEIRQVLGVFDFVRIGGEVVAIASSIVDRLLDLAVDDGTLPLGEEPSSARFNDGDNVWIRNVSFDTRGVFRSLQEPGRAIVEVEWFGRFVPVSVAENDLSLDNIQKREEYPRPNRRRRRTGKRRRLRPNQAAGSSESDLSSSAALPL